MAKPPDLGGNLNGAALRLVNQARLLQVGFGPMNTACDDRGAAARNFLSALVFAKLEIVGNPAHQVAQSTGSMRAS